MSILRALVAGLVLVGCASPAEDVDDAPPAVDEVVTQAAIREISCDADSRQRHAAYHLRLSADGVVHDGTVLRGFSQDSPDYRVEVRSVEKKGDRLHIEMSEGESQVRFTISAAGFAAKTRAPLDAKVEATTDRAILDAPPGSQGAFSCTLSDSMGGLVMIGADATKLFSSLRVEALDGNAGGQVKVVDTKGPFRLYCSTSSAASGHLCTIRVPAIVSAARDAKVSYAYDLDATEANALRAALAGAGGAFTGTSFESAFYGTKADAKMSLKCTETSCRAEYTMPDAFYANVEGTPAP